MKKLRQSWYDMIRRCENPNIPRYKNYGAKGIKVYDPWHDFDIFKEWAVDNGWVDYTGSDRKDALSIDRIDSNKDYCPENCQWITVGENSKKMAKRRHVNNPGWSKHNRHGMIYNVSYSTEDVNSIISRKNNKEKKSKIKEDFPHLTHNQFEYIWSGKSNRISKA